MYTYLPTGASVTSTVTGLFTNPTPGPVVADQRFFPYAYLASAPGIYTVNTAPYLDGAGLQFSVSPSVPSMEWRLALGAGRVRAGCTCRTSLDARQCWQRPDMPPHQCWQRRGRCTPF